MPKDTDKERIQALTAALSEYAHAYYVLDAPMVSDYEYDMLLRELAGLEMAHPEFADPNSPTKRDDLSRFF